jgi:GAF domain-containing protein
MRLGKRNGAQKRAQRKLPLGVGAAHSNTPHPAVGKLAIALREYQELAEQHAATAEILRVISNSPGDSQAVFDAILTSAMRLCEAHLGLINVWNGQTYRTVAQRGAKGAFAKWLFDRGDVKPLSFSVPTRMIRAKRPLQIEDLRKSEAYRRRSPGAVRFADDGGVRTYVAVPLLREGGVTGFIVLYRSMVRPFTQKQIALVQTFADQAVIAIENARLFNETKEALERQTATADILKVIAGSPTDLAPVFQAILRSATRLCSAERGLVFRHDGEFVQCIAGQGLSAEAEKEFFSRPVRPSPISGIGRVIATKRPVQVADVIDDEAYRRGDPLRVRTAKLLGARTAMWLPLLKGDSVIGIFAIYRQEVRPFSDQQIALVQTFADQAAIAIENVRLFNETKEALERQTATAEILRVISSSPDDMQPVFDSILEHAMRLCDAGLGTVGLYDGKVYTHRAQRGGSPEYVKRLFDEPFVPQAEGTLGRMIAERRPVHIPDYRELPAYRERDPRAVATVELGEARTYLAVPMLKDGQVLGGITIRRTEVRPFTQKQIDLLSTFANQAVIAIENVRLFNETKEALERQTATADILRVISRSQTDLQPAVDAIVDSAKRLCGADRGGLFRIVDGQLTPAHTTPADALEDSRKSYPRPLDTTSLIGRSIVERRVIYVPDFEAPAAEHGLRVFLRFFRSQLTVPMFRGDEPIGALALMFTSPSRLSHAQIELVKTFADQAVIAIENVRLFNETKEALERQTATADVLKVISASPADVRPVLNAVAERAAAMFGGGIIASVFLVEGDLLSRKAVSSAHPNPSVVPHVPLNRTLVTGRAVLERRTIEVTDILPLLDSEYPGAKDNQRLIGWRALVAVPLIREGKAIGAISISSQQPRAFPREAVKLLETFADQAVIAIENARLFNETKEALERQTATTEILRVISSTPTDTKPVFDAIVEATQRLIAGKRAGILVRQGDKFVATAFTFARFERIPEEVRVVPLDREKNFPSRAILDGEVVHIPDWEADDVPEFEKQVAKFYGVKSGLIVPLMRKGEGIGALAVARETAGPYHEKEIALLRSFADQAVIAIENVRLFNETKESLERQTATADILKVIAGSPSDVQPVFDAIIRSASRLSGGCSVNVSRLVGDQLHLAAYTPVSPEADELLKKLYPVPASVVRPLSQAVHLKAPFQVGDFENDPGISERSREVMRMRGFRSTLYVPIMRGDVVHGVMHVSKVEPGPFPQQWVDLLKTFADQAAIAIENVRLFNETKEALERQTATSDVLRVISGSPTDVQPVLDAIAQRAAILCQAKLGFVARFDGTLLHMAAFHGASAEALETMRSMYPVDPSTGGSVAARVIRTLAPAQVPDVLADEQYAHKAAAKAANYRAVLGVPLVREGEVVGAIIVARSDPGAFPEKLIELLKTFADQAVIAIENVRLFNEIQEKSRQLETASQHKSQFLASMSHELRTPLNALLGFNEMILGDIYGEVPGDMKPPLMQMQASGRHLLRLINNVLDLAKIEAGRMELALADYSVQDIVEGVRSTLRPLAAEKGLELLAAVPADIPLARGDAGRITQCLMNLAGNSLKFTKAGKVEISVAADNGLLRYCVTDTGIGIPADKMEGLFTEFRQTDAAVASEYGGTGLGLSISKKFVEMHGGRIWVQSEPGRGSAFTFEVPLRAEAR